MRITVIITLAAFASSCNSSASGQATVTRPAVSEEACPLKVISVSTPDRNQTAAVVRKPPGKGPFPAVVLLHGGLRHHKEEALQQDALTQPTSTRFLAAGFVIVNATFRDRVEDPQTRDALVDCLAIVEHVKKMPEVDPQSVVVFGGSGGGSLALELAGETEFCAAAAGEPASVLFTGIFNRETGGRDKLNPVMNDPRRFYTPELEMFTREKIQRIACPVLIVHGDKHPINKINHEIVIPEMKRAMKELEVIHYPGQPHGFYDGQGGDPQAGKQCFDDMLAFFKTHLPIQPMPLEQSLVKQVSVGRN